VLDPPPFTGTAAQVAAGATLYSNKCIVCHGVAAVAGALVTDIRHSAALNSDKQWQLIVHDGLLKDKGMVGWAGEYTPEQIEAIRQYVIRRANDDKAFEKQAKVKADGN
jgi:alcohol dehydrogenase (cytochrome c)/quinohemoprotein ethanol dehydrogenase